MPLVVFARPRGSVKSAAITADVHRMAAVAGFLFLALVTLGLALVGVGCYYWRVLRPQLEQAATTAPDEVPPTEALATFVEQLQELARLRDLGLLTSREFTSKKTQLLERI